MVAVADGLHAVLIGIDAYPKSPLTGCVNDVLGIGDWLVKRAGIPEERITRLVAGKGAVAGDLAPTLANIRSALSALARLGEGSRVLLYYSGHGVQEVSDAPNARISREAIVPLDAWPRNGGPRQLLWDHELNALLCAVVAAKVHLTCVLDCCHSAGASREVPFGDPAVLADSCVRSVEIPGPTDQMRGPAQEFRGLAEAAAAAGWAHVVACEASELAREANVGAAGERHGLLTRALLQALDAVPAERAHEVRWSELWYRVLDHIAAWNSRQHPRLFEAWNRPVLGGRPDVGDTGLRVTRRTAVEYLVHAGTIAGLDKGSELAVYDAMPAVFPAIGSPEDEAARLGKLRLTEARCATADAVAVDGRSFDLPSGARARVIVEAPPSRLAVRADLADAPVRDALAAAADRMRGAGTAESADVWLARRADGALVLGDTCYTALDTGDPRTLLVLDDPTAGDIGEALEHYRRYCEPLRMARRCRDLPNALEIEILDCSDETRLAALAADKLQDPDLPRVRSTTENIPMVHRGQRCCVRVANTSPRDLVVVGLLCCSSDGQVDLWGEQLVPARGRATYWLGGVLGNPFIGTLQAGRDCAYERVIAIGTTVAGTSFKHLELRDGFVDALDGGSGDPKDIKGFGRPLPPPEQWTGTIREVWFDAKRA